MVPRCGNVWHASPPANPAAERESRENYDRSVYIKGYLDGLAAAAAGTPKRPSTTTVSETGDNVEDIVRDPGSWSLTSFSPLVDLPTSLPYQASPLESACEPSTPRDPRTPVAPISDYPSKWPDFLPLSGSTQEGEAAAAHHANALIPPRRHDSVAQAFPTPDLSETIEWPLWAQISFDDTKANNEIFPANVQQFATHGQPGQDFPALHTNENEFVPVNQLADIAEDASNRTVDGTTQENPSDFDQWLLPARGTGDNLTDTSLLADISPLSVNSELDISVKHGQLGSFSDAVQPELFALLPSRPKLVRESRISSSLPTSASLSKISKKGGQLVFRVQGRKRSKFDDESRNRTALTRQIGACRTCRDKKIRCNQTSDDPFVPCERCAKLSIDSIHLLRQPCCRVEIHDLKLFRLGSTATPHVLQQWTDSKKLGMGRRLSENGLTVFEHPRRVQLTQDLNMSSFTVTLARFLPGPDDETAYRWKDAAGSTQVFEMPPYFIADMDEAKRNIRHFFRHARAEWPKALLKESNPIVQKMFSEAERFYESSKSELVAQALYLWSATRLIERTWLICGEDLLGFPPMTQRIGPCRYNTFLPAIPVTPVMDTQLDELSIEGVLKPFRAGFLRLLKRKVLERKKENWYEIYIASFLVLHDIEVVLDHALDFAHRFGISWIPRSNSESSLSHAYLHACKTILAYYHFASGSAVPLTLSSLDGEPLHHQQVAFIREMQAEIASQGLNLDSFANCSMYNTEMFWCIQLLFTGWNPESSTGDLLGLTEKDFMFS